MSMPEGPDDESLRSAFISPATKRQYVRRLFSTIASRYDLITRLLSFGRDQRWKQRLVAEAPVRPGARVLDIACGTGDLALLASGRGAEVFALDFAPPMVELARQKSEADTVRWMIGDMGALPLAADSMNVVTTGYGLRNVPDLPLAIGEIYRVLLSGGVACSLDFDRPASAVIRSVYLGYLTIVGGTLGWILHGDPDTYRYIPASIRRYPGAASVAQLFRDAGFREVRHIRLLGGLMALHVARK
jgi:ubiquinone/menaquinone biosynthesis methyltransferase